MWTNCLEEPDDVYDLPTSHLQGPKPLHIGYFLQDAHLVFQNLLGGQETKWDWNGKEMFYKGAGEDLCGGFFFWVWALICDLEHANTAYDLPNPTSNACCPLCPVGLMPGAVWFDFRPSAKWLQHIYNVQTWLARGLNRML